MASQSSIAKSDALPGRAADLAYLAAVGERVRHIRAKRGISRKTLAQDSGVSERYLAVLEGGRGNASILLLKQIAQAMGVAVEELARSGPDRGPDATLLHHWIDCLSERDARRALQVLRREFAPGAADRQRRIALIGLRGAGKTTLGSVLAGHRRVPFVELDREIERAAGAPLAEVFLLYGQPAYRRYERRSLEGLIARDESLVIATGGGIVSEPETFDLLLSACYVIWLKATPEEHMARVVAQGDHRPIAGNHEAMDDLKRILAGRDALYRRADATIDTSGSTVAQSLRLLERAVDGAGKAIPPHAAR